MMVDGHGRARTDTDRVGRVMVQDGCRCEDIGFLAEHLRESDRVELRLASGRDVSEVLSDSVSMSGDEVWTVYAGGEPVAVFGGVAVGGGCVPWLVATDRFPDYAKSIIRVIKRRLADAVATYGYLFNYVHAGNEVSVRWLSYLGFRLSGPFPFGVSRALFYFFEMGGGVYV